MCSEICSCLATTLLGCPCSAARVTSASRGVSPYARRISGASSVAVAGSTTTATCRSGPNPAMADAWSTTQRPDQVRTRTARQDVRPSRLDRLERSQHGLDRDRQRRPRAVRAGQLPQPSVTGLGRGEQRTALTDQEHAWLVGRPPGRAAPDELRPAQALADVCSEPGDDAGVTLAEPARPVLPMEADEPPALTSGSEHGAQLVAQAHRRHDLPIAGAGGPPPRRSPGPASPPATVGGRASGTC